MAASPARPAPHAPAADAAAGVASLWQAQPTPAFRLSPAALAAAEREHARLRRAVGAKSAAMVVALAATVWSVATIDVPLIRLGSLAAAAAYARVLYTLQRTRGLDEAGAAAERAGAGLASPSLVHYRAALMRERDRLTGGRLWWPFAVGVPGCLLGLLGIAQRVPTLRPYVWLELAVFAVAMPLALVVGRRRARRFQARIDDLDALTGGA